MKVVNLFAGHGTWLKPWLDAGHDVWATDIEPRPGIDIAIDVLDLPVSAVVAEKPDVIIASPDCTAFSVASIGTHWTGGHRAYVPKTAKAHNRLALVHKTAAIIEAVQPKYFVIENPRGLLRKLGVLDRYRRETVWYCQYGDDRAKPTDLWTNLSVEEWQPRLECFNGAKDHAAAPRGAKTGTQGLGKDARSFIPYELSYELMKAMGG